MPQVKRRLAALVLGLVLRGGAALVAPRVVVPGRESLARRPLPRSEPTMRFGKKEKRLRSAITKQVSKAADREAIEKVCLSPKLRKSHWKMKHRLLLKVRRRGDSLGVDRDELERMLVADLPVAAPPVEAAPTTQEAQTAVYASPEDTTAVVNQVISEMQPPLNVGLVVARGRKLRDDLDLSLLTAVAFPLVKAANKDALGPVAEETPAVVDEPVVVEDETPEEPVAKEEEPAVVEEPVVVEDETPEEPVAKEEEPVVVEETPEEPVAQEEEPAVVEEPVVVEDETPEEPVAKEEEPAPAEPVESIPVETTKTEPVAVLSIAKQVDAEVKVAMKAKDKAAVAALRNIKTALATAAKDGGVDSVEDGEAVKVLRKLAKMRQESIDMYEKAGDSGAERAAAEKAELVIIERWLPQLADEATVRQWVQAILDTGDGPPNKGKIMGALMKDHKDELDGKMAQQVVSDMLAAAA